MKLGILKSLGPVLFRWKELKSSLAIEDEDFSFFQQFKIFHGKKSYK